MTFGNVYTRSCQTVLLFSLICFISWPSSYSAHVGKRNVNPKFLTPVERELLKRSKAADLKSWMNTTEDPCNDFYEFACGNWHRINSANVMEVLATDQSQASLESINKRVHTFLNTPTKLGASIENKIHTFYESCLNIGQASCAYSTALKKFCQEFGQFSYLKKNGRDKINSEFSWWSAVARIQSTYGITLLISTTVSYDLKSKSRAMVYVDEPKETPVSFDKVKKLIKLYGANAYQARNVAENVEIFENALHQAGVDFSTSVYVPDEQHTLYNISDAQELFKGLFDLETFLRISLNTTELPSEIYVQNNKYFENLVTILADTDPDTVEDYILLTLLDEYQPFGVNDNMEAWCDRQAQQYFSNYIENIVYKEFRSVEYELELYDLWQDIKSAFLDNLSGMQYQWMSNITREYAIRKLKRMSFVIDTHDDDDFKDFYKDLQVDVSNYVGNTQSILQHKQLRKGDRLTTQAIDIPHETQEISASYSYVNNQISIPIRSLQPFHLWHPAYPKAIKYAALGSVVAHEMLHAFDDHGRHYDAEGNVNNWWDEKSSYEFEMRRRCFQSQYHNYTFGDHRLPNKPLQGENIADNAGIRVAYSAYNRWLEREKESGKDAVADETLKNLPYNNHELFFISYGQLYCTDINEGFVESYLTNDRYAPHRFRVIGPLSNYVKFSQVFKCYTQSAMNPMQKCEIF